jgi:hypothetical protein
VHENGAVNNYTIVSSGKWRDCRNNAPEFTPHNRESTVSWVLSEIAVGRASVGVGSDGEEQQVYPAVPVAVVAGEIDDIVQGRKGLLDYGLKHRVEPCSWLCG